MNRSLFRILLCAAVLSSLGAAGDDPIVVIVNARNPTSRLGAADVKNMFVGNVAFWQGTVPITLVVRPSESEAGIRFLGDVLDSTAQRFDATWQARQLAGRGVAPRVAAEPDDVAALVAGTPGAVGYMLASEAWSVVPAGVKVLEIQ